LVGHVIPFESWICGTSHFISLSLRAALENEALYDTYMSTEDTQTIGWIAVQNMKHAHMHEELPVTGGHAHIMMHNQVRCV
jgi:hypothetical protein